jgi:Flp pilus assembly protein TadG
MFGTARQSAPSFARREDGGVAMIFALSVFPLAMAMGCAIDLTRASHAKTKLTNAVDNATLAAAKMVKDGKYSDGEIAASALALFSENMKDTGGIAVWNPSDFKITINRTASKIDIEIPAYTPTTFARVGGIEKINLLSKATAVFALRDIEVGLALDVTGSMEQTVSGKKKIDVLKSSFEKFANLMLPDNPLPGQKVRLGLAPYSAAINLGSYASVASANRSADGCVTERSTSARYSDASLVSGGVFNVAADGKNDKDPTEGLAANAYSCPNAILTPLSDNRAKLVNDVKAYKTGGWTGGHFGVQWAWNLISPEWTSVWPSGSAPDSYSKVGDKKLIKAVILMTDGVFNTTYHNSPNTASDQAIAMCNNMKALGVQVFAIAFNAPAPAQATLKACASSGSDYYADASSEAQLDAAFAQFAGKINALRLAQ